MKKHPHRPGRFLAPGHSLIESGHVLYATVAVLLLGFLLPGCFDQGRGEGDAAAGVDVDPSGAGVASRELTLFAASSLTDVMDAMGDAFTEVYPEVEVVTNYASSSRLAIQLTEGAPADLFASANPRQMDRVVESGRVDPGSVTTFAHNRLVAITPAGADAGKPRITEFSDIAEPGLSLVLASPAVPVRDYTDRMVAAAAADFGDGFRVRFYENLVSEESNVRQVTARIALGEADLGVVYATDVTEDIRTAVRIIEIPSVYNVRASYPLAPIKNGAAAEPARRFMDFVLGAEGRSILEEHNFSLPEKGS